MAKIAMIKLYVVMEQEILISLRVVQLHISQTRNCRTRSNTIDSNGQHAGKRVKEERRHDNS